MVNVTFLTFNLISPYILQSELPYPQQSDSRPSKLHEDQRDPACETAESIAMLRAAEYAASLNIDEWQIWESVIEKIQNISVNPGLQ